MKNRRFVIGAFLLVAVLCLGVGFATLQQTLSVTGSLSFDTQLANDAFDEDVYFTGTPSVVGTATDLDSITAVINSEDNDNLVITVNAGAFSAAGETATVTVEVLNDSTDALTVSFDEFEQPSTSFVVSHCAPITIEAGQTGTLTVTIELVSTSATVDAAAINMSITAATQN